MGLAFGGALAAILLTTVVLAALQPGLALAQTSAPDPKTRLDDLFARIESEQRQLKTLSARFEQRQEGPLLLEPEVATGQFYYRAPDQMSWQYESPERTLIVLRGTEILTWYQDQGYAERLDGGRQAKRLWRALGAIYLGTPQALADLRRYFHLHVTFAEALEPLHFALEPRDSTIARRVQAVDIWLDPEKLLPVRLRQAAPDGSATEFQFEDLQPNAEIDPERFEPLLPPDVDLTERGGR